MTRRLSSDMIERARAVRLEDEIERRGVKLQGRAKRVGPCPACGGDDRFSVNTTKQLWNCRGCGKGGADAISLTMHLDGVDFCTAVETLSGERAVEHKPRPAPAAKAAPDDHTLRDLASARRIVAEIVPLIGSPGEAYLRDVRKIEVATIEDVLSRTDAIGWHRSVYFHSPKDYPTPGTPEHPLHGQRLGCIIGIMTDAVTAEPTGAISRTYLGPDGTKVGKAKTLGSPRGLVRLSPDDEVLGGLIIAEGIETALSAIAKGFRPAWATGDRGLMANLPVLNGIEALLVIADHDEKGDGEKAARAVEARWLAAGKEVKLRRSDRFGDLNDLLKGSAA